MTEKWKIVLRFLKYVFISAIVIFLLGYLVSKWAGYNTNHFRIKNDYDITLCSNQCMTCFMDWDIDFEIQITELKTRHKKQFTFHSPAGPQFIFATSPTKKLLIKGYNQCSGLNWIIDVDNNTISDFSEKVNSNDYTEHYKLTTNFEIEDI